MFALGGAGGCITVTQNPPPPPPEVVTEYVVEPGDTLTLRFERNPELNEDNLVVRPDGMISPQLIAEVSVAGKTPAQISAELERQYAAELAHPRVKVGVKSFTSQRVSVAGEVETPGVQPLLHGLTLSQAIHHAGGFLKTANRAQVVVIRHHRDGHVSGHAVDLALMEVGVHPEADVPLQALDQIYVPKTAIANVNTLVEQYIRNNVPVNSLGIGITPF
ncbi:MAG: polysaccharide biosynthesis/export family protein [Deltaproteobacteria bacterium]|nr:polysaccharide biosynthesis/export family protein [Deltaproteobacteria bacterium]